MATGGRQVKCTARLLLGGTWDSLETRLGLRGMLLSRDTSRISWHLGQSSDTSQGSWQVETRLKLRGV